jgi:hypothetical protein
MILAPAAVEDDLGDTFFGSASRHERPNEGRHVTLGLAVSLSADLRIQAGSSRHSDPDAVVYHLGVYVPEAPEDGEPGPGLYARDPAAKSPVTSIFSCFAAQLRHL